MQDQIQVNRLFRYQQIFIAIILFCLTFLIYFYSSISVLSDSIWAVHISSSIINAGDINLDEYEQHVTDKGSFGVIQDKEGEHLLPFFPIGNSLLAVPIVWSIEHIVQLPEQQSFYQYLQQTSPTDPYLASIQRFIASLITALVIPVLYYVGYKRFDILTAVIGVLIFAFGTTAYSTASRVLWQHTPSMLMLTITLALFVKGENNPRAVQWAGLPLAFSFIIRPTNSIPIIIFTTLVFFRYRKQLPGYLLGAMIIAVPFFWSNQLIYSHFLPPYYNPQRIGSYQYFTEALAGNLISPSRGLFLFSPIFFIAIYGISTKLQNMRLTLLEKSLLVIIGLHWLMISTFRHWWAGHSYGPRFFTDILPFMTYFVMLGFYTLRQQKKHPLFRQIGMGIFALLASISISIHYIGANNLAASRWSLWPVNVDMYPSTRLWNWSDPAFLRTADDWPLSGLRSDISFDFQTFQTEDVHYITLHNTAKESYLWEIKLPSSLQVTQANSMKYGYDDSGVPIITGETALPTDKYQVLPITVMKPLESFIDSSLGAIMVVVKTVTGEEKTVQVIPVSIVNNGQSNALNEQVSLPSDIYVNNGKADRMLYGLYGYGWYGLESFEQYQWRWARSPAELYIFSEKPRVVTLELKFNSIYSETGTDKLNGTGILHISTDETEWAGQINEKELKQITLSLNEGWNTLLFNLEAGNFVPADVDMTSTDNRKLSFTLDSINIVTTTYDNR